MNTSRARSPRARLVLVLTLASAGFVVASPGVPLTADRVDAAGRDPHPFAGDTSWIAYQTYRDGHEGVWLVHPDGSGDHEVDFGLPVTAQLPDWSPDGRMLAVTTRGGETEPLYEHELSTGVTTQLFDCSDPCLGDDEPAYAPDGRHVAFVRALGPFVGDVPSTCGLWVGDRQTGQVRELTSNPRCDREYYPRWSPDGERLTYQREHPALDGSVTTAVHVVDADGKHERRITTPGMVAGEPDWSPDGEWIVFSTYPLNVFQAGGDSDLYRIHPDGSSLQRLTAFGGSRATQPKYSRDGDWIVFTAVRPRRRVLWAIPAEGGDSVVIADRERIYTHGNWQPH